MARSDDADARAARWEKEAHDLSTQVAFLQEELALVRRKLTESPRHVRQLEERLAATQAQLARVTENNERLVSTLKEARAQIVTLKEEIDRLAQPPSGYGVFLTRHDDGTVDVFTGGRKLRVAVSPSIEVEELRRGQEVLLNDALNVVDAFGYERVGEVVMLKEILETPTGGAGDRALVISHADEERIVHLADTLIGAPLRSRRLAHDRAALGVRLRADPQERGRGARPRGGPRRRLRATSAACTRQIEQIRDAVELPFLHADLFREHQLRPPKGILLYGPPGCGKTLIAKAVANSLAKKIAERRGEEKHTSYFLNIKGPELLNKYVGETERHIRLIFQRAREKAGEGTPVIVFFDEMDSVFRTRGSGVSSDVENTIVPQLLSARSTAWRGSRTSSSSAPPTART